MISAFISIVISANCDFNFNFLVYTNLLKQFILQGYTRFEILSNNKHWIINKQSTIIDYQLFPVDLDLEKEKTVVYEAIMGSGKNWIKKCRYPRSAELIIKKDEDLTKTISCGKANYEKGPLGDKGKDKTAYWKECKEFEESISIGQPRVVTEQDVTDDGSNPSVSQTPQ
eukprot:NODE_245_length_12995_cov_0.297922.p6 type:complete len:170 gc:universal NODE_245_length_12995_cov_0.297922:4299-3790(-)